MRSTACPRAHEVPVLHLHPPDLGVAAAAHVVHEDVDAPEALDARGDQRVGRRFRGEISRDGDGGPAGRGDRGRGLVQPRGVEVAQRDARAFAREQQRDLAAQTVGGSSDDGDSVTYSRHRDSSCTLPGANHRTARRPEMTTSQSDKAARFRALHEGPRAFVIANPWDAGSARVRAALGFQALAFPLMLTARTESFLRGNPNLDDVIKRLQAFEKAGADVLMAPGLPDLAAVRAVCAAVSKPVNFMAGIKAKSFTVAELEAAGVHRISLATSLYRYAMTNLVEAAREVKDKGTFGYIDRSIPTPDLAAFMQG